MKKYNNKNNKKVSFKESINNTTKDNISNKLKVGRINKNNNNKNRLKVTTINKNDNTNFNTSKVLEGEPNYNKKDNKNELKVMRINKKDNKNELKVGRINKNDNKNELKVGRINKTDDNINELKDILKYNFDNININIDYELYNKYNIKEYKQDHIINKPSKGEEEIKDIDKKINIMVESELSPSKKDIIEYYNRKYLEKILYNNNDVYDDLINNQKVIFDKNISILKQDYNNNATLYKNQYLDSINDDIINIYNKLLKQYNNTISKNLPNYIYNNINKSIYPEQLYILNLLIKPYSYGIYNNINNNNQTFDIVNNSNDYDQIINNFYNITFQQSINFYQQFDDLYYIIHLSGYDLSYDDILLLISYSNFDINNYNLNKYQLLDILLGCIKHIYNTKYLLVLAETLYNSNTRYNHIINSLNNT
jgi:hypothetical protein